MEKKIFVFILLISCIKIQAQFEFQIDTTTNKCKSEFKKAENDFLKNSFILKIQRNLAYDKTQRSVIKDLGIKAEYPTIFIESCYNLKIKTLLNKKFGANFLELTEEKAKYLDKNRKGNSSAKLKTNDNNLIKYIQNRVSKKEWNRLKDKYSNQNLWIVIDISAKGKAKVRTIGNLKELKVSLTFEENINNIIETNEPVIYKLIHKKEIYLPKIENGLPTLDTHLRRLDFSGNH